MTEVEKKFNGVSDVELMTEFKDRLDMAREIKQLRECVRGLAEGLKEVHSLISTTSYTEGENGSVIICGNEWPWIPRGIHVMKKCLKDHAETIERCL